MCYKNIKASAMKHIGTPLWTCRTSTIPLLTHPIYTYLINPHRKNELKTKPQVCLVVIFKELCPFVHKYTTLPNSTPISSEFQWPKYIVMINDWKSIFSRFYYIHKRRRWPMSVSIVSHLCICWIYCIKSLPLVVVN